MGGASGGGSGGGARLEIAMAEGAVVHVGNGTEETGEYPLDLVRRNKRRVLRHELVQIAAGHVLRTQKCGGGLRAWCVRAVCARVWTGGGSIEPRFRLRHACLPRSRRGEPA